MRITFKGTKPKKARLDHIIVEEISPVGLPANDRPFLVKKSVEGATMADKKFALSPDTKKALLEKINNSLPALQTLQKTIEACDEVESMGDIIPDELGQMIDSTLGMLDVSVDGGEGAPEGAEAPKATPEPPKDAAPKDPPKPPEGAKPPEAKEPEKKAEGATQPSAEGGAGDEAMTEEDKAMQAALKEVEEKAAGAACPPGEEKTKETPATTPSTKAAVVPPTPEKMIPVSQLDAYIDQRLRESQKSAVPPAPAPRQVASPQGYSQPSGQFVKELSDEEVFDGTDMTHPNFLNRFGSRK